MDSRAGTDALRRLYADGSLSPITWVLRQLRTKDGVEWRFPHLYEVKVAVRPGRSHIPQDRHLADAYPSAVAAPGGFGSLCDIAFYPAAIANDLARWRRYHAAGRLEAIPPDNLRQYWGSILAHELAHCLDHGSGEQSAERWERKALDRLRGRADPLT